MSSRIRATLYGQPHGVAVRGGLSPVPHWFYGARAQPQEVGTRESSSGPPARDDATPGIPKREADCRTVVTRVSEKRGVGCLRNEKVGFLRASSLAHYYGFHRMSLTFVGTRRRRAPTGSASAREAGFAQMKPL